MKIYTVILLICFSIFAFYSIDSKEENENVKNNAEIKKDPFYIEPGYSDEINIKSTDLNIIKEAALNKEITSYDFIISEDNDKHFFIFPENNQNDLKKLNSIINFIEENKQFLQKEKNDSNDAFYKKESNSKFIGYLTIEKLKNDASPANFYLGKTLFFEIKNLEFLNEFIIQHGMLSFPEN